MTFALLLLVGTLGVAVWSAVLVAIFKRKMHIWLPRYIIREISRKVRPLRFHNPVHILFCLVDHFEPGWNGADLSEQRARVDGWAERYASFAQEFVDADGFHPRHTWFYPPHYFREEHILKLLSLCNQGFGEIEMHLHHNRMKPFPDTSETLRQKIRHCIDLYSQYGIFKTKINGKPQIKYAFIHGDWALDNSRNGYCGVNDEITILKETGCYADFTFPSYMVESQPRMVNTIYYATDVRDAPKSYDIGQQVRVRGGEKGDLLMVQGPLGFRFAGRKRCFLPSVEDGEISKNNPPTRERVDFWIRTRIHIQGRPDWIFIKVFAHGASMEEQGVLLDEPIRRMHRYLQRNYNDGKSHKLHYVTARELVNIIRAAEADREGNPGQYRNFHMKPYEYEIR